MADCLTLVCVLVAAVAVAAAALYRYLTSTFAYFEKRGIVGPKPKPLFGNYYKLWNKVFGEVDRHNVQKYGKVFGTFDGRTPNMVVADPDMAGTILDKERNHFQFRRVAAVNNPYLKKSISILAGESKEDVVVALNQEKIRKIVPRILKSDEFLIQILKKSVETSEASTDIIYAVQNFIAYTLALSLFDKDTQAEEPKVDQNEFSESLEQVLRIDHPNYPVACFPFILPNIYSQDNFVMRKSVAKYFISLIQTAVKEKVSADKLDHEKKVPDLLDLLLEIIEGQKKNTKDDSNVTDSMINEDAITAQILAVLLNAAQATKHTIVLSIVTLASKPEIQDKLYTELKKQIQTTDEISYETVKNAEYLDMFLGEVLRKYPSEYRNEYECVENTEVGNLRIEKGTLISIPVYAIHHLEEYYPEPDTFNPERFSPAVAEKWPSYAYLPFGMAGSNAANVSIQFGVLVSKLAIAALIKNFRFIPSDETKIPPTMAEGITGVMKAEPVKVTVELRK